MHLISLIKLREVNFGKFDLLNHTVYGIIYNNITEASSYL